MTPIRVVLAERSAVLRAALREYIARHGSDIAVVGEAGDVEEAAQQAAAHSSDVLLLDLHLPGGKGWEAARRIKEAAPGTCIILVSARPAGLAPEKTKERGICVLEEDRLAGSLLETIRSCGRALCGTAGA